MDDLERDKTFILNGFARGVTNGFAHGCVGGVDNRQCQIIISSETSVHCVCCLIIMSITVDIKLNKPNKIYNEGVKNTKNFD